MDIKEAKAECNLWVKAKASINLVYDRGDGKPHFISCDTTALEIVLSELEKKEKVINEMAKHIQENEFYDDIICMEKNCKNEECHGECGEDCIKEYFTNKVEKEGK